MMFEQENHSPRGQKVHHHMMHKTLFISLLAIHPMVEDEGVQTHSSHHSKIEPFVQLYHYGIDTTKRQKIALWNKKYALNPPGCKSLHDKGLQARRCLSF